MDQLWQSHPIIMSVIIALGVGSWIWEFIKKCENSPKWKSLGKFIKWSLIILISTVVLIICFITYSSWPEWLKNMPWAILVVWYISHLMEGLSNAYGRIVGLLMDISDKLSRIESKLDKK